MVDLEGLEQTWNPRSKKWVLINTAQKGGIKGMSSQKYEGVPVRNGKPEPKPEPKPELSEDEESDISDSELDADENSESGFFGW